jgi:Mn-dependent DtxR family transcriptional regulator
MMLSDVMEDYLKTIYYLQGDGEERIRTSDIASHLDVTSPTVTSMLEKLEDRGLVDREKYKGVRLTDEGETVALEVLRHHRLLEAYLTEHLDYDWSEVHDEADRLEHHISEKFERRLADLLGDPEVDPHGDPIPNEELDPPPADEGVPVIASPSRASRTGTRRSSATSRGGGSNRAQCWKSPSGRHSTSSPCERSGSTRRVRSRRTSPPRCWSRACPNRPNAPDARTLPSAHPMAGAVPTDLRKSTSYQSACHRSN